MKGSIRSPRLWFVLILVGYAAYAAGFIWQTSAVVEAAPDKYWVPETRRYFVLFDDAMISMRYARNLANGDGLVWNPGGARVEGYTNPAWVAYMALFHLPDIHPALTSLLIQVSGAVFLLLNLLVVRALARRLTGSAWAALGAVIFTAFYLPLNTWSLQGTEVSVLTLVVSLSAWGTIRALDADRFGWWVYALLGASTLVRMDMAIPLLALAGFLFLNDPARRWRHAAAGAAALAAFLIPQTAFRLWYYDEWLPNTYYLKVEGYPLVRRILAGLDFALRVFVKIGVLPFVIFIFRRDRALRLLATLFLGQVLYSIYVGGDAWEWYGGANRYISLGMPLFFVLLAATLHAIQAAARAVVPGAQKDPRPVTIGIAAFGAFLLVAFNATYGPGALREWLLLRPSLDAGDNGRKVEQALWVERYTAPNATVALAGAGIVPYFTERTYIDLLGKNDKVIARQPMDQTIIPEFKPGHMKWDYVYSIGTLRPDCVMELWVDEITALNLLTTPEPGSDEPPYLAVWSQPHDHMVYMRRGSPAVRWDLLGLPGE